MSVFARFSVFYRFLLPVFPLCAAFSKFFGGIFFLLAFSNFQIVNRKIFADEFHEFLSTFEAHEASFAFLDLKVFFLQIVFWVFVFGAVFSATLIYFARSS